MATLAPFNQNRLISIVLVAFVVAIVAFIFMRRERRALESGLQAESVVVLNAIEAAAEDLLYRLDVDGLQQLMDAIGEQHPVVSSRIYDSQGRIIADATGTETLFCIEPDSFGQRALQSDTKDFEWYSDRLLVVRAVRAGPELIGAISVGLSTDKLFNQVAEVRIRVATLATTS